MDNGFIKLHRKMTEWEWFSDSKTFHVFMFLLINANHKDKKWRGIFIKRGQILTGRIKISEATNLSERKVRTALSNLELTGEVTIKTTSKFSIITICNYNKYQNNEKQNDQQVDQQTTNKRPTNDQQTTTNKNEKNEKNEKKQPCDDDEKFYSMKSLSAMAVRYLGWNGNLSPGQAEQLRPLTAIFRDDVDYGFNAAASSNAKSAAYVIKAAGSKKETSEPLELNDFQKKLIASGGRIL